MKTLPVSSKAAIQFVFPPAPSQQIPGPLHCLCALELDAESSSYWTVYKFFASQSQRKYKIIIFFFGEANDEANFSFFILLHKRAKPAPSLVRRRRRRINYLVLRMQNP